MRTSSVVLLALVVLVLVAVAVAGYVLMTA